MHACFVRSRTSRRRHRRRWDDVGALERSYRDGSARVLLLCDVRYVVEWERCVWHGTMQSTFHGQTSSLFSSYTLSYVVSAGWLRCALLCAAVFNLVLNGIVVWETVATPQGNPFSHVLRTICIHFGLSNQLSIHTSIHVYIHTKYLHIRIPFQSMWS